MNKLTERYIYDVTRRLPEEERTEVGRELEACIADMLPDTPEERDVIDALMSLGAPRLLAEQYRQKPRCLISPAVFELYISVLKSVAATVAGIFACIGIVTALPGTIAGIIASGIKLAVSGALQATFWVTFGFAMHERFKSDPKPWTVSDLPQLPPQTGIRIPRAASIAGMVLSVFFTAWVTGMIVYNQELLAFVRGTEIIMPFTQAALERSIPYVILLGGLGCFTNALKLFWARWNLTVCIASVINNAVWICVAVYIIQWSDLLSDEFIALASAYPHIFPGGLATVSAAVFVITGAVDIGEAVWKTYKGMRTTPAF